MKASEWNSLIWVNDVGQPKSGGGRNTSSSGSRHTDAVIELFRFSLNQDQGLWIPLFDAFSWREGASTL
jgi:hypothetical protein